MLCLPVCAPSLVGYSLSTRICTSPFSTVMLRSLREGGAEGELRVAAQQQIERRERERERNSLAEIKASARACISSYGSQNFL